MRTACFEGHLVDVPAFMARAGPSWRKECRFATCPQCCVVVHPYGAHSPGAVKRFDHPDLPRQSLAHDCALARRGGRFRLLETDELDAAAGRSLRDRVLRGEGLVRAYAFVSRATGYSCSRAQFAELVRRADARGAWSYVDLCDWAVPFVLLSLGDFVSGSDVGFHYVLQRTRGRDQPWKGVAAAEAVRHPATPGATIRPDLNGRIRVTEGDLDRVAGDLSRYRLGRGGLVEALRAVEVD